MKNFRNYNNFILLEKKNESIKNTIEDILIDISDLGLKTNVIFEEKEGIKFYEVLVYSDKEFKRDETIIECIRRVSRYLSQEYKNPFLDIEMFRINNTHFYRTDGDRANLDHGDDLYKWYFGFIVSNAEDGYYLNVPSFWHHNYAKKSYNHKIF
jgi:hypothetical protein